MTGDVQVSVKPTLRVTKQEGQIYVITFDRPDSSANILDSQTFEQLNDALDTVSGDSQASGLIFRSAKDKIFIAGANIHEFLKVDSVEYLTELLDRGQKTFQRIADLKINTVAAIHGQCLGGGCELALACDRRIATNAKSTKIGLPEVMLGIIPAWGGSTRLPRLIGLPSSLDMILGGKRLSGRKAKKRGLVDEVVSSAALMQAALNAVGKGPVKRKSHTLTNNAVAARVIANKARSATLAKTHGHYPAPLKALDVVVGGLSRSVQGSLDLEKQAAIELAQGPVARNLIGVFLLQERAKHLTPEQLFGPVGPDADKPIDKVNVVGAGVMGAGIAQWSAAKGHPVILKDINPKAVLNGMRSAARVFSSGVKRGAFDKREARNGLDRITPTAEDVPLRDVDLVIEAATERLDLKKKIFARLEELSRDDTILATNTSALSIDSVAEGLRVPERVIGIHFFNPVHRMQLVEIVIGPRTDKTVAGRVLRFVQSLGKLPVVAKDSPGFLVNRVLMPYLIEAGHLFAGGAEVKKIDKSMKDFGMPMGPLRLLDEVGLDTGHHVASFFAETFADRLSVPSLFDELVKGGHLGRKSGSGFYVYGNKKETPVNDAAKALQTAGPAASLNPQQMQRRMVLLMLNEAARCIEEEVVHAPEDVDLGMIMGTGFAPFRGGPLRYADTLGLPRVVEELNEWDSQGEARFQPCALLQSMATANETFYK